jgi:hypothetical protein
MFSKKIFLLMLLSFFLLAGPALAAETEGGGGGGLFVTGTANLRELGVIIARIINFLLGIVGAIAIIMIVVGGFRYIVAGGDMKATQSAKGTITFAVVGLVIVLLSVAVVNFIGSLLGVNNLNFIQVGLPS